MGTPTPSIQLSFRLSRDVAERLDTAARATGESRNALAERLLDEALRIERHPMIRFMTGGAGRREPTLAGTRLRMRDVVLIVRENGNDVAAAADYLGLPQGLLDAGLAYYADFTDEVDADIAWAEEGERIERQNRDRVQALLA